MRCALIFGLLCFAAIGCGDESVPVEPPQTSSTVKVILEDAAETGQPIGSGGGEIQMEIDRIKETDPAKADKLQKQFDDLVSTQNPAQVKAKAKTMLAEL